MKTIVVAGAQSNIGKTTVAKKICSFLPNAVFIKVGKGNPDNVKTDIFYTVGTSIEKLFQNHNDKDWLVIESNQILKEFQPDCVVYLTGTNPKPSAQMAKEKADIIRDQKIDSAVINTLAEKLGITQEIVYNIAKCSGALV